MTIEALRRTSSRHYLALGLGALALALAGYLGYVFYPRFALPAGAGAGLLLLAAGAGVASFFSPCSSPCSRDRSASRAKPREGGRCARHSSSPPRSRSGPPPC